MELADLPDRLEACREVVKVARADQPDLNALWARDRKNQKRK